MKEKIKPKISWKKVLLISVIVVLEILVAVIVMNMNSINSIDSNSSIKRTTSPVTGKEPVKAYTITFNHYEVNTTTKVWNGTHQEKLEGTITVANYAKNISGYTFTKATTKINYGVYDTGEVIRDVTLDSTYKVTGSVTINMYYTKSYTVTFNHYKTGTTTSLTTATTASVAANTSITPASYKQTITGYTYSSAALSTATSTAITSHTVTGDVTINLYYTPNNYTVTFNHYKTGTTTKLRDATTASVAYDTTITLANYKQTITGYTYNNATLSTATGTAITTHKVTSAVTINLYYNINNYTVTFNHYENGTSTKIYTTAHTASIAYNTSITLADYKKTITGFTYKNATLSTNTSSAITSHIVTANVTINMYYTRNNYTVTFNHYENGTSTKVFSSAHTVSKAYNSSITLADFKKSITGYNYTKATLSTNTSSAITTHTVTGNVTINMYYTKKNNLSYTINYRYLNGSNKVAIPGKTSVTGNNQTYGATLNLATYATAIPGYRFAYIHHDGTLLSGTTTTIKDSSNVIDICYDNIGKVAYTVNYLEYGTNTVVHPADSSPNGDYGTTVNSKNDCYIDLSENGYYFCYIQSQNQYKIENQQYKVEIKNQSKIPNREVCV